MAAPRDDNRSVKRRDFVLRAAAVAVAPGAVGAPTEAAAPSVTGWAAVRAQFELRRGERNFAAWYLASHPKPVRDAIERHRRGLDASPHEYVEQHAGLEDEARAAAARYLETEPGQVALTDSTTMGLGLLYNGVRVGPGQELLTSVHDFYATHEALRLRAARTGARVKKVALYRRPETASVDEIVSSLEKAVTPKTRVIALTWVHSSTGVKLPVRELAAAVHDHNRRRAGAGRALLCLDGVHGFGVEAQTPEELGVDFLVSGCHKWLFGPRGTGLVWGRREAWADVEPAIPTFARDAYAAWLSGSRPAVPAGLLQTPGGFHSFEHRWALGPAFRWRLGLGRARVAARTHALVHRLREGLDRGGRFTVVTPRDAALSAGLVMLRPHEGDPADVVAALGRRKIVASVTPYRERYLRLGPSIVNDEDDVDAAVRAIRDVM